MSYPYPPARHCDDCQGALSGWAEENIGLGDDCDACLTIRGEL